MNNRGFSEFLSIVSTIILGFSLWNAPVGSWTLGFLISFMMLSFSRLLLIPRMKKVKAKLKYGKEIKDED